MRDDTLVCNYCILKDSLIDSLRNERDLIKEEYKKLEGRFKAIEADHTSRYPPLGYDRDTS